MKVFSQVIATFHREFSVWLPPQEELTSFIEQLSGFEVEAIVKDGQLGICSTLEAINSVEDALSNFVHEKEEEEDSDGNEILAEVLLTADDDGESFTSLTAGEDEQSSQSENLEQGTDTLENQEEDDDLDDCLNIEVIHSEASDVIQRKKFKHSCALCSFKSQRESHFLRHLALHDKSSTIYRCDQCTFSTLRFMHLRKHQVIHSAKTLSCSLCNYTTDEPKLLSRHSRLRHRKNPENGEEELPVTRQCPACPYNTTRNHLYERHMKVHSADESKGGPNLHICSLCDYRTTRKIHYTRHIRDVHRQARPYLCHLCGKAFKRAESLKHHSQMHTEGPAAFKCHICSKMCHSKTHLKEHGTVHSTERTFLCEICGAGFKSRSGQRKHIANLHEKPRAFQCSVCNKRFNTGYALRRHMKTHPNGEMVDSSTVQMVVLVQPEDLPKDGLEFPADSEESSSNL